MIHFHGGPITPTTAAIALWTRRHALVSFERQDQTSLAFEVAQSVLLDNGAFTLWRNGGGVVDVAAYADWVRTWERHPGYAGALILAGSRVMQDRRMPSPIETSLRAAILDLKPAIVTVDLTAHDVEFEQHMLLGIQPTTAFRERHMPNPGIVNVDDVYLFSQARCSGYRVDLVLWNQWVTLAVECDGHDWHERTQQQAAYDRARDRELIRVGATVIRFTGSEIYRDAEQCAREVASTWGAARARVDAHRKYWEMWAASRAREDDE